LICAVVDLDESSGLVVLDRRWSPVEIEGPHLEQVRSASKSVAAMIFDVPPPTNARTNQRDESASTAS